MNGINPIFKSQDVKEACYQVLLGIPQSHKAHKELWSPTFSDRKYIAGFLLNADPDYLECMDKLSLFDISRYLKKPSDMTVDNLLQNINETIVKHYEKLTDELLLYYQEKLIED